jgi:hypothetical protein
MATNPTRRHFLVGLVTGFLGLWAERRVSAAVAPVMAAPLPAAPRADCSHPRLRSVYGAANRCLTTTFDAGPCRRCHGQASRVSSSTFVYDGRTRPRG